MAYTDDSKGARLSALFTWRSAICQSDLDPMVRLVALTLSLHMNEMGGSAFPGSTRLARETGLHLVTVKRHLRSLLDTGWLELVERGGVRGERKRANAYRARIPGYVPLASDDGLHSATGSTAHRVRQSRSPVAPVALTGSTALPQDVIEDDIEDAPPDAKTAKAAIAAARAELESHPRVDGAARTLRGWA